MAYGDACEHHPRLSWEEFEFMDYKYRLEDLLREWYAAFRHAHTPLEASLASLEEADIEWRRLDKELEEAALEFVAYCARLRLANAD